MKKLITISLLALLITGFPGCAKKPEGSTGKMADLYKGLHDIVLLNRQYKAGKVNKEVFEVKNRLLDTKIRNEFNLHKDDVWIYSSNLLKNAPINKATRKQIDRMKPVVQYRATDKWTGELAPLTAMYCMLPMQMTTTLIQPGLTQAELNNIKYAFRPVQLLRLDEKSCTTAFLFGSKIITVDFIRQDYRWKPLDIKVYIKRENTRTTS